MVEAPTQAMIQNEYYSTSATSMALSCKLPAVAQDLMALLVQADDPARLAENCGLAFGLNPGTVASLEADVRQAMLRLPHSKPDYRSSVASASAQQPGVAVKPLLHLLKAGEKL